MTTKEVAMKRLALVAVLLLLAFTPQPARATIELTFSGAGTVAPVVVPFSFGNQQLGNILTLDFTLCFKQAASPQGSCDAGGTVTLQQSLAAPFFLAGRFRENLGTGVTTPVNFPVTLNSGQRLLVLSQWVPSGLGTAADSLVMRGTPTGGVPDDINLNLSGNGVAPGSCPPSTALCLNNNRFKVQSQFLTLGGAAGGAGTVKLTGDTGYAFFFDPANVEAVVKVLNACPLNNRYWVFAGGLTDVRTVITVTDTQRNAVKTYVNPQGSPFQPIQDTSAFATCP